MIYIGTSGFSYDDWVGPYYPQGMPKGEFLAYYAREFPCTEVNATYYAIPSPATTRSLARKTSEGFLFSVKLHQGFTHDQVLNAEAIDKFRKALAPLVRSGKLGCLLAQFPTSFKRSAEDLAYLEQLQQAFPDLCLIVEFRHRSWLDDSVFQWLRQHRIGFCCVDEPRLPGLMPPVAEATGPLAYVRFHGRNARTWYHHEKAWERYDYTYTEEELQAWIPKIEMLQEKAQATLVFFNNHYKAQAIDAARRLRKMLDPAQVAPTPAPIQPTLPLTESGRAP